MSTVGSGPVVVGLAADIPDRVVDEAVAMARDLRLPLACVYVDESRVPIGAASDGSIVTAPIAAADFTVGQSIDRVTGVTLAERIASQAAEAQVTASFHTLAGDPVTALARFAVDHHARMIVVGTRHQGVRASLSLLIAGPIASRLARRQPVPVLIVPLHDHSPLPTEADGGEASDALADVPSPDDLPFGDGHA